MFSEELRAFRHLNIRQSLLQCLNFATAITSFLMVYQGLGLVLNTESPVVVVLSGSMEPAFRRGDLLILTNPSHARYHTGDIAVYRIPGAAIPIVHRVLETHDFSTENVNLRQLMLTKGDNNPVDDFGLYQGLEWLERKHVVGKVRGFIPYVGYITIVMNDIPELKYALFGGLGLAALLQRE